MTPSWEEIISKKYNLILERLNIFGSVVSKEMNLFLQVNCRIIWVYKMAHHVSFEAIETYLHKNIYPSYIMRNKGKKANFWKACKTFSMLHGQLMYNNKKLVISSTEQRHTIISNLYKWLGHDPKGKAMVSHYGRDSKTQEISNRFFWHKVMSKRLLRNAINVRSREKLKSVNWTS